FDTSDRLYFEPLDARAAESVARVEGVAGAGGQVGGQTGINLAQPLDERDLAILGSSGGAIGPAAGPRAVAAALDAIGVPQPLGDTTTSVAEALTIADRVGYPVLVRPSYVLGGRAMEIVHDPEEMGRYMEWARQALPRGSVLVDKYLMGVE